MHVITNWADIEAHYLPLTEAEEELKAACSEGHKCHLGDGKLPPISAPALDREIRAPILRFFILGGCPDCPAIGEGVRLYGAHITGQLNLSFASAKGTAQLISCRFDAAIEAMHARFEFLVLNGSHVPGLIAQGAQVAGGVFLSRVVATAEVRLANASVGGQLVADGAQFTEQGGMAFNAQGAQITGGVFLNDVRIKGEVSLAGATIDGMLDATGASFENQKGNAFFAQSMRVTGAFFWRNVTCETGDIDLVGAHVANLTDDLESWPGQERIVLDGFTYDRISGAQTNAAARINWLKKGAYWQGEFFPQPFTQLAKVLREIGHEADARKVLSRREHLLRRHARQEQHFPVRQISWAWHRAQQWVVGYGHHPERSVIWLAALWLIAVTLSHMAWEAGDFAPNSDVVQTSADWRRLAATEENPGAVWAERIRDDDGVRTGYKPGQDWETFNRYAYGADLVIPIMYLGQTEAWAPSTERGPWGRLLWTAAFFLHILGWIVTALGAAAITGIIRRD